MKLVGWACTRYRVLLRLHPLFHRRGEPQACVICSGVWAWLLTEPAFVEGLRQGNEDMAAGRFVPFRHADTGDGNDR